MRGNELTGYGDGNSSASEHFTIKLIADVCGV